MSTYCLQLAAQTLLALAGLGLAGGWLLAQFRRNDRPHFWLAAPLAGIFVLGGTLAVLYFLVGLSLGVSLWFSVGINILVTAGCLVRNRVQVPALSHVGLASALGIGVATWATVCCNKSEIECEEPSMAVREGSDMMAYAMVSDWLREHPAAHRPDRHNPIETLSYCNLYYERSRPVTFLLAAAAAEFRGTTGLFAYDWASGVILAAGILGAAGLFSVNSTVAVLLALGCSVSTWLTNTRTGFMGKSIAYPGALLLAALFLQVLESPTRLRLVLLIAFQTVLAFTLNPIFVVTVYALFLPGYAVVLCREYLAARLNDGTVRLWPALGRPVLVAALIAASSIPAFVIHRLTGDRFFLGPKPPADWGWVLPVSLDLEMPTLIAVSRETLNKLLWAAWTLLAIALGTALYLRNRMASVLLGTCLIIPALRVAGMYQVYILQALIYPLTLAGTACLARPAFSGRRLEDPVAEPPDGTKQWVWLRSGWTGLQCGLDFRLCFVTLLLVASIGLRFPQFEAAAKRYVFGEYPNLIVYRQSEAKSLREAIGQDGVDIHAGHVADVHMAWGELAARGVSVKFRQPGYDISLLSYLKTVGGLVTYDPNSPKSRYTLVERNAWAPEGSERWVGSRLKLVEDNADFSVVGISHSLGISWDRDWHPGFWIGKEPVSVLINNGTGRKQSVLLVGDMTKGNDFRCGSTFHCRTETSDTLIPLDDESSVSGEACFLVPLETGLNKVELFLTPAPASPTQPGAAAVRLLEFRNWRIERLGAQISRRLP